MKKTHKKIRLASGLPIVNSLFAGITFASATTAVMYVLAPQKKAKAKSDEEAKIDNTNQIEDFSGDFTEEYKVSGIKYNAYYNTKDTNLVDAISNLTTKRLQLPKKYFHRRNKGRKIKAV